MSAAPGSDARAKTAELVAGLSPREQIDLLAQALLREHMHRCGFKRTLKTFDTECPRDARTIASRAVMRQMLNIPPEGRPSRLQRIRNKSSSNEEAKAAALTFMEELCSYRLTKREQLLRSQGADATTAAHSDDDVAEEEEEEADSDAELAELRARAAARQKLCHEAQAMIEEGRQLAERRAERRRSRAGAKSGTEGGGEEEENEENNNNNNNNNDDEEEQESGSEQPRRRHHSRTHRKKKDREGKAKKGAGRRHRSRRDEAAATADSPANTFLTGVPLHDHQNEGENSDDDDGGSISSGGEEGNEAAQAAKALLTVRAVGSGWQPPQSSSSASTAAAAAAAATAAFSLHGIDTSMGSLNALAPTVSLRDAPAVPRHSLTSAGATAASAGQRDTAGGAAGGSEDKAEDDMELFAPNETQATIKDIREELRRTSNAGLARSPPPPPPLPTGGVGVHMDPFARPRSSFTSLTAGGATLSPHAAAPVMPERQEILKVWQPGGHAGAAGGTRPGAFRPASLGGFASSAKFGKSHASATPSASANSAQGAPRPFAAPATSSILMHHPHGGPGPSMMTTAQAAAHAQDSSIESEGATPPAKTASLYSYDSAAQPRSSALVSRGGGGGGGGVTTATTSTMTAGSQPAGGGAASALQSKRQGVGFHSAAGDESGDKAKRRNRKVTLLVD